MKTLNINTLLLFACSMLLCITVHAQNNDEWDDDGWNDDGYDEYDDPYYDDSRRNDEPDTEAAKYRERINDHCENKYGYRTRAKKELHPYTYSNGKTALVKSRRSPQIESFVVPIYYDYQHSIIINTEGTPDNVPVKVYNGPRNDDDRKVLFETEKGKNINAFELSADYDKSKIYVEYLVPPNNPEEKTIEKGCIVFVMGYLDDAAKEFMESSEASK